MNYAQFIRNQYTPVMTNHSHVRQVRTRARTRQAAQLPPLPPFNIQIGTLPPPTEKKQQQQHEQKK